MNPVLRGAVAHVRAADVQDPLLDEDSTHHLFRVLRIRPGESVTVTDGVGSWRPCRAETDRVVPDGETVSEPPPVAPLTVAVAVPKADRPEWLVRKVTEIGVDRLVWLHCRRSVVRWDDARASKARARLDKVVTEASLQSRRVWFPTVEGPVPASCVLGDAVAAEPGGRRMAAEDWVVAVGPEGGWDPDELAMACACVDLGPHVLRAETAALVAAAELVRLRDTNPAHFAHLNAER